jgi:hypothetical protein
LEAVAEDEAAVVELFFGEDGLAGRLSKGDGTQPGVGPTGLGEFFSPTNPPVARWARSGFASPDGEAGSSTTGMSVLLGSPAVVSSPSVSGEEEADARTGVSALHRPDLWRTSDIACVSCLMTHCRRRMAGMMELACWGVRSPVQTARLTLVTASSMDSRVSSCGMKSSG